MPDYRSDHSTNVRVMSFRTTMTRSTRSSRMSAEAPALAASMLGYRAHAAARSDAVPRPDESEHCFPAARLWHLSVWRPLEIV
jgi:hypothetical protein